MASKRPLRTVRRPESKKEVPLHLSTNYTERLRAIGRIIEEVSMRNFQRSKDMTFSGSITDEEVRRIYILTKVRRVNGKRHRSFQG